VARQRLVDDRALVRKARVVNASAATGPARSAAPEKRPRDRGRSRGVADAHFSEANEVGLRPHGAS
jgi:hypothetical protein